MPNLFIGPFKTGLELDKEPYLLPDDAFTDLENAYVFRGTVRRKMGNQFLGRLHTTPALPEVLPVVDIGGATASGTLATAPISPGTVAISVATVPAMVFNDNGNGTLSSTDVDINFGTIDYETGDYTLTFSPVLAGGEAVSATDYRVAVRTPVMGLSVYETATINQEALIAFSQNNAFNFNTTTERFDEIATGDWNSSNTDFFHTTNYFHDTANNRLMWAVNNVASTVGGADGIQYYNGTTWTIQNAAIQATTVLRGALLIVAYRNRLVALNTLEGAGAPAAAVRRQNRARWSQNGTPIFADDANSWRDDVIGRGGFIDAPTTEAIVSAEFYKDTLIVFFERSTWKLRYTGNELLPFIWEQINSELGSESSFSTIPFDDGVIAVGDKRIISANSNGVTAIDQKIPDEVFNFHNDNSGPTRVHGIRDYFSQLAYWSFPNDDEDGTYPNRILVLNYVEGSYAFYRDSYTCFGRWVPNVDDFTWATLPYDTWSDWAVSWGSPRAQSWHPSIIGGNQLGVVSVLEQQESNDITMDLNGTGGNAISNANPAVFRVLNHNRTAGDFVKIDFTRAFGVSVAAEALGTALSGTTQFVTSLANLGVFTGTTVVTLGAITFTDIGNETLVSATAGASGIINYQSGHLTLNFNALGANTACTVDYDYNIINTRVFEVISIEDTNTFTLGRYASDIVAEAVGTALAAATQFTATLGFGGVHPGTVKIIMGSTVYIDGGNGTLPGGTGGSTINYSSGEIVLNFTSLAADTAITASYTHDLTGYAGLDFSGAGAPYTGTGEIAVIDNFLVKTKRFSPFIEENLAFRLNYINLILNTADGEFEVNTFLDQDPNTAATTLVVSSQNEEPNFSPESSPKKVYINTSAKFLQLQFNMSPQQLSKTINYQSEWQINGMLLNVNKTGELR